VTPTFVEAVAEHYGIGARDSADFMKLCWQATKKTHLEDMDADELTKVASFIEKKAIDPPPLRQAAPQFAKGVAVGTAGTLGAVGAAGMTALTAAGVLKQMAKHRRKKKRRAPGSPKARTAQERFVLSRSPGKTAELLDSVELQPHQADSLKNVSGKGGQILNWGLGSGKTLGAFAIAEKRGGEVIVVSPASLRVNFKEQFEKFVSPERRKHYHFYSYEQFRKNPEMIVARHRPKTLIADEMHRLRNASPREPFERIRHLVPYMVGLTGSMVNNRPEEMVPLVNLVAGKKVFKSVEDFKSKHIQEKKKSVGIIGWLRGAKPGIEESPKNMPALGRTVSPYVHKFTGDPKYEKHTPRVRETTVKVPMSDEQQQVYKFISGKNPLLAWKIKHNLPPSKSELKNMNAFMAAMRQVSNSPAEFDKRVSTVEESIAKSPKFKKMLDEVGKRAKKDPNFRSMVFSNFLRSGVEPIVAGARARGVGGETFTGKLTDKERASVIKAYNKGDFEVLGLSPAGGEGLDLKGVKLVQLTEPHWNPERANQAIGRAARFKSHTHLPPVEREVLVQRFHAVHPKKWWHDAPGMSTPMSSDEWIDKRRLEKETLNRRFVQAIPTYDKRRAG
jgi:hypothetical protein